MDNVRLMVTEDGSHTLYNASLDETYHSRHGAVQESIHVFIRHGLDAWLEQTGKQEIRILEIGFGTGLNALLTCMEAEKKNLRVMYESWEKYPLEQETANQLNYTDSLGHADWFKQLHQAPWNQINQIDQHFQIIKKKGDVVADPLSGVFDIIYFDAFAPSKQPEIWSVDTLAKVARTLASRGIFTTYCARGQVKRDLRHLGLTVETLEGPPGKKEMTRAIRPGSDE